jgi:N-acyl-D-amino-acid deacylase
MSGLSGSLKYSGPLADARGSVRTAICGTATCRSTVRKRLWPQAFRRLTLLALVCGLGAAQDFDLILQGGRIVDGMGNPWYRADLGIRNGRIAAIGDLKDRAASQIVALREQTVTPGFIDMMAGSSIPLYRNAASGGSKLQQGITTMLAGEGGSDAPQGEHSKLQWRSFAQYFQLLEQHGVPLNVVHNVGAAQIRQIVIGDVDRAPSAEEMERMKQLVGQAMIDGAAGLSTALIYPPGTYARTDELVEMAKVAAKYGGFYSTHMRNESSKVLDAIGEALEIGRRANIPVHIYHLKAAGEENWPLMQRAIDLIRQARADGMDVTADIYPYIRNGLGLGSLIHPRHYAQGSQAFLKTLSDSQVRRELRREIETTQDWENWYRHVGSNWDNVLVAQMPEGGDKKFEGKSIAEIAKMSGKDQWNAFFDLVQSGEVSVNPKSMNEEQKYLALRAEFISFCTDSEPIDIAKATNAHPRAFGSFPRVLAKYVREEKIITLEMAIRKMTSLPANRLKLYDRGRIAPGMAADLVIFDPNTIQDTATFIKPLSFSTGISYVLVNGKIAIDHGQPTGEVAGKVLRYGTHLP